MTSPELDFLCQRHLGTLTTVRPDGTPHVVAIAFTFDGTANVVRIITKEGSRKVKNVDATPRAAVCQVEGARWLTLEGRAVVVREPGRIGDAVRAYEVRYQPARPNPSRVAIEIEVERVMGRP